MDAIKAEHLKRLREREVGREVFLRPLPLESTVDDVREMVVSKCGEERVAIDRVKLLKTAGGSLMSAFLTLSSEEEARHCTAQLNGASFGGQVMAASPARNREGLKKAKEPCMFFLEGKCMRGDTCQFAHEKSATPTGGRRLPPCKFFASGGCSRGQDCKFSHEKPEDEASDEEMTSSPVAKVKVSKKEQPKEEAKAKGSKESKGGKLKAKKTSEVEFSELADEVDEEAWNKPKKVSKKVKVKSEQPAVPAVSKLKAKKASEPSDPAVGKKKRRNEIKEASVETVDTIPAKKKLSKKAPKQEEQKDPVPIKAKRKKKGTKEVTKADAEVSQTKVKAKKRKTPGT